MENTIFGCHAGLVGDISETIKCTIYEMTQTSLTIPVTLSRWSQTLGSIDSWKYGMIKFLEGALAGQTRQIASNDAYTANFTNSILATLPKVGCKIKFYWDVSKIPVELLNNTIITGVNFSQTYDIGENVTPEGGKHIFPIGMTGVTFVRCNLDNVYVPIGNTVIGDKGIKSTNKTIQKQNDLEQWVMRYDGTKWAPKEPINKQEFIKLGLSIDPIDIPKKKRPESVTQTKYNSQVVK